MRQRLKAIPGIGLWAGALVMLCLVGIGVFFLVRTTGPHPYQKALADGLRRLETATVRPPSFEAYSELVVDMRRRLSTATPRLDETSRLAAVDAVEAAENAQTVWNATRQDVYPEAALTAVRDLGLVRDEATWIDEVSRDETNHHDCIDTGNVGPSCAERQSGRRKLLSSALRAAHLRIGRGVYALRQE